jgi:hypothetical protein
MDLAALQLGPLKWMPDTPGEMCHGATTTVHPRIQTTARAALGRRAKSAELTVCSVKKSWT